MPHLYDSKLGLATAVVLGLACFVGSTLAQDEPSLPGGTAETAPASVAAPPAPDAERSSLNTSTNIAAPSPAASTASPPIAADVSGISAAEEADQIPTTAPADVPTDLSAIFHPVLRGPTQAWVAALLVLLACWQGTALFSMRNVTAALLALSAFVFLLRDASGVVTLGAIPISANTLALGLLVGLALFALVRGLGLVFRGPGPAAQPNLSRGGALLLLLAGLGVAAEHIVGATLSPASKDGLVGGVYTAKTGRLPYGEAEVPQSQSPLVYLLYAGAARLGDPRWFDADGHVQPLTWDNRATWRERDWPTRLHPLTPALAAGGALLLIVLAVYVCGLRLAGAEFGAAMAAILCVHPAITECLGHVEWLVPAALLSWSVAVLFVPGVGAWLAPAMLVIAGAAWSWAWLGLPALLAFFARRSLPALLAALVGTLGGAAALLALVTAVATPSWPYLERSFAAAGVTPAQYVSLSPEGPAQRTVNQDQPPAHNTLLAPLWRWLLAGDDAIVDETQRAALRGEYERGHAAVDFPTRARMALRTMLESVWLGPPAEAAPQPSTWAAWRSGGGGSMSERIELVRRLAKGAVIVLALGLALAIFIGRPQHPGVVAGAMLVIAAGVLLAGATGAASNWVWLLPLLLIGELLYEPRLAGPVATGPVATKPRRAPDAGPIPLASGGSLPRITIER